MPNRPARITGDSDILHVLNQNIDEMNFRIDQALRQIPLHKVIKATATLNFGAIQANTGLERSATVLGATQKGSVHDSTQLTLGNASIIVASEIVAYSKK